MISRLLLATTSLSLLSTTVFAQNNRAIFMLDRSGSMTIPTQINTSTRCADSLAACKDEIATFFDTYGSTAEVMIVEFDSGANFYRRIQANGTRSTTPATAAPVYWIATKADALLAAGSSTVCSPGTMLAASICQMVTDMEDRIAAAGSFFCTSYFYVYSDGGENSSGSSVCNGTQDTDISHRCPCDTSLTGNAYDAGSWQHKSCKRICEMAGCILHTVFNARKFSSFSTDAPTAAEARVFRFLNSQAAQTGGTSIEVDDSTGYTPGHGAPFTSLAGGCSYAGQTLSLNATQPAQVNSSFTMQLVGSTLPIKFMLLGFQAVQPIVQFPLAPQGCYVVAQPDLVFFGALLPNLTIPNNPSLAGASLYFQGLATDPSLTNWITSNGLRATIQP